MTAATRRVDLICLDVDGTIVGDGGRIHARVWPAVTLARAAGIRLVLCTGRPGFGLAREYAARLDEAGWHMFQNGGSVVNFADGSTRSRYLPSHVVQDLITRARASDDDLELYSDASYVVERPSPRAHAHADLLGVPYAPRRFDTLIGAVVRAQWMLSHDAARAMRHAVHDGIEVARSTSPVMPDTTFVGMTCAGVTKGTAVRDVADAYHVPLSRVMFVGDGDNDVAALRIVGYPVAMQDADQHAIESARFVVGHVDDGAVADALRLAIG